MKTIEKIFDITTEEINIVERDLTDLEIAEKEKSQLEAANRIKEQQEKMAAKQVLLEKLGITADEAKLLLS